MCVLKNYQRYFSPMDYFINARSQLSNDFMTSSVPCFFVVVVLFFSIEIFFLFDRFTIFAFRIICDRL